MKKVFILFVFILFSGLFLLQLNVEASTIAYNSALSDGVPVTGQISDAAGEYDPVNAQYYYFTANGGDSVVVFGDRLEAAYDMSFWLFFGLFADTNQFGVSFDSLDSTFAFFGDDQDSPNISGGLWGDPRFSGTVPFSGYYTVAVTNYISAPSGDGFYDFRLQADGVSSSVPEPATMLLLGSGLIALWVFRKKPGK
jgi:hypothetical protein